jgi:acetyl esterase/lipase
MDPLHPGGGGSGLQLDPELAAALEGAPQLPPLAPGDVLGRRARIEQLIRAAWGSVLVPPDVEATDFHVEAADGASLLLRWYAKRGSSPGSAIYYCHGGGMIRGSVDLFDPMVARYVGLTGIPLLSVDYRLAPEFPHPTPIEDVYAGLTWLADRAIELSVDPKRICVMGDSAGGGLAAGVTLLARDRGGPAIARQLLIYPMLDDRTRTPDPLIAPFARWSYDDNLTGWGALLGEAAGGEDVSPYAAPARASSLAKLPPAYLEVGDLDIFRDEDVRYALRLSQAGVPVELHLHPGVPHGFESIAIESAIARRTLSDRIRFMAGV